jgi:TRAP-type C4-dicarboxylate transport system substrate-binding protein
MNDNKSGNRIACVVGGALLAGIAALASAPVARAQDYPEMSLKMAHGMPETYTQSEEADKWFFSELERRTGGKIKVQIFWNGSLARPKEVFDMVGKGGVAFGGDGQGYYPAALPLNTMPNALVGTLTFGSASQASIITREIFEKFPEMQEEFKALGIWPLYFNSVTSFRVACTKPILKIEDLKNKKIRQFSAYHPKLWESLGAVGVTVLPAEIYEGLQRGRLDCAFYSYPALQTQKLYEQAKYISTANLGGGATWPVVVNYDLYHNKWPANVRKLLAELAAEAEKRSAAADTAAGEKSLEAMKANGAIVNELPAEEQKKLEAMVPDFLEIWAMQQPSGERREVALKISEYIKKRRTELQ